MSLKKRTRPSVAVIALGWAFSLLTICSPYGSVAKDAEESRNITIRIIGESPDYESLQKMVPSGLASEIGRLSRGVASGFPGAMGRGSWHSNNGEFALQCDYEAGPKHDRELFSSTLSDDSGRLLWKGPAMSDMMISNNGRNLVGWGEDGYGLAFYDIQNSEPVKCYGGEWGGKVFSYDGNYLVASSVKNVSLFSAQGDSIWSKRFTRFGGTKAIISSNGSYVLVNDRIEVGYQPKTRAIPKGPSKITRPSDERFDAKKEFPTTALLKDIEIEPPKEAFFTLVRTDGSIVAENSVPCPYIHYMTFSPNDGEYGMVAGPERLVFFRTEPFEVLWTYEQEGEWIGSLAISADCQFVIFGTAQMREGRPRTRQLKLFNVKGDCIGHLNVDRLDYEVSFTAGSKYLVSWNNGLKQWRLMELSVE